MRTPGSAPVPLSRTARCGTRWPPAATAAEIRERRTHSTRRSSTARNTFQARVRGLGQLTRERSHRRRKFHQPGLLWVSQEGKAPRTPVPLTRTPRQGARQTAWRARAPALTQGSLPRSVSVPARRSPPPQTSSSPPPGARSRTPAGGSSTQRHRSPALQAPPTAFLSHAPRPRIPRSVFRPGHRQPQALGLVGKAPSHSSLGPGHTLPHTGAPAQPLRLPYGGGGGHYPT